MPPNPFLTRPLRAKPAPRGLRNVMERIMLDITFRLPSMPNVRECLINRAVIEKGKEPVLLFGEADENLVQEKKQAGGDRAS